VTILTVQSRKARAQWRTMLDVVLSGDSDVVIERNGKAVAVLIPIRDYQDLQEELDDLRATRRADAAYAEFKNDPDSGKPWAEVRNELVSEGLLDE
jgi:prevent-host-death family protein